MSAAALPFVSVVVPVWNGEATIAKCLASLAAQDYPADRFEVLVVDNGSTDSTPAIVAAHPVARLLSEPIASSYRARNLALAQARGDVVAFTDADCIADRGWIAAAVAALMARPDAGVVGGRITLFEEGDGGSALARTHESLFSFNQARTIAAGFSVTANWASPAALLRELGGFDAKLRSGGDAEMSARVRRHDRAIVYAPDMVVQHPIRGTIAAIRAKYVRTVGGKWALGGRMRFVHAQLRLGKGSFDRVRQLAAAGELTLGQRARLVALVGYLHGCGIAETIRLQLGGEPRRS